MASTPGNIAIIVAAGSGSRAGSGPPKQFRNLDGKPLLRHSAETFANHPAIGQIIVVIGEGQTVDATAALSGLPISATIIGGKERIDSVRNALQYIDQNTVSGNIFIHDAARPFLPARVIDDLLEGLRENDGAVPVLPVVDSLSRANQENQLSETVDRERLFRIQTPQAFRHDVIIDAHKRWNTAFPATDDARMAMVAGYKIGTVAGDEALAKFTFASDFESGLRQPTAMIDVRTGSGYDVHRLQSGEELWLCGISIDHDKGLAGHSDADVALHALTDAILGAAALGDIGQYFPPSDPQWRGASSDRFLRHAAHLVAKAGFAISNVDVSIICEAPRVGPHRQAMRERVSDILRIDLDRVSIKATTTEKLGFTGRGEGIAAMASVTLAR